MNWLTNLTSLSPEVLKQVGVVATGALLALGTYVLARIKEARKAPDQASGFPRISLSPEDRDLAYTLARTGTDLTRALHTHGELLAKLVKPAPMPRVRRRTPRDKNERPMT